jgi:hypothetical protein
MEYFYIHLSNGDVYGSFDTKSEALRYANNAGFTQDWELVEGEDENLEIDLDGGLSSINE